MEFDLWTFFATALGGGACYLVGFNDGKKRGRIEEREDQWLSKWSQHDD